MAQRKKAARAAAKSSAFRNAAQTAGVPIETGKQAMKHEYRSTVSLKPGWTHTESVDLDKHFEKNEPNASRWDYGLGLRSNGTESLFWVEPHLASSTGDVGAIIKKVEWLKDKLGTSKFKQLRELTHQTSTKGFSLFCWIYAGVSKIVPDSKEAKMLAQHGMKAPSRHLELPVKSD